PSTSGQPIPNIEVLVNVSGDYIPTNPDLLKIVFNGLGTTGSMNINITKDDTKIEEAKQILINELDVNDIDTQRNIYDGWTVDNLPNGFLNAIKGAFNFGDGLDWDIVVDNITLTKGDFPDTSGQPIPNIEVLVNVSSDYIPTNPETLKIVFDGLGTTGLINLEVKKSDSYDDILTKATGSLLNLLTGDFIEQREKYNGWNNNSAPIEFREQIKGILSFNNETIDWDNVVEDVVLNTAEFPSKPGDAIPPVGISINLKDIYNISSGKEYLSFNSNSFGSSNNANVSIGNMPEVQTAATTYLKGLLTGNHDNQRKVYESWDKKPNPGLESEIQKIVKFNDASFEWKNVVNNITISNLETFPPTSGNPIPAVKIEIILNDGYEGNLSFNSNSFGNSNLNVSISNPGQCSVAATNYLKRLLNNKTYEQQKNEYESWVTQIPIELEAEISKVAKFTSTNITWEKIFKNFSIKPYANFPSKGSTSNIPYITITINFKEGYGTGTSNSTFFNTSPFGPPSTSLMNQTISNMDLENKNILESSSSIFSENFKKNKL
ncbi:MAG: hypothetical protein ACRCUM_03445, partial [Mycoplasmoidaceae bacterium]